MKLLDAIKKFLGNKDATKIEAPEGHCPNCWGRQEYNGQLMDAIVQENIDLNNLNEKVGWIQAYATQHFEGIKLKPKDDVLECAACKLTYEVV